MEYNSIIDDACKQKDQARRLAYIAIFSATCLTTVERNCTKPFNPLLGETYEYVDDNIEVFTEQVSHHPPVSANFCRGKKSNYTYWNNFASHSRFTGKSMEFSQIYRTYIEMHDYKETYEIQLPCLSVHNLIIGTTYIDIGGSSTISLLENKNLKCQLRYTKRGWLSKEEFKVEGEVS